MKVSDFYFSSVDGKHQIHGKQWLPAGGNPSDVKAVVQIAHGIAEYLDRYDGLGQYLAEKGIAMVGGDHLGHGGSIAEGEVPGYFAEKDGWRAMVDDVEALRVSFSESFAGKPYFMMGHSMGSFIMRNWAIMYPHSIAGLILSGTGSTPKSLVSVGLAVCRVQGRKYGPDGHSEKIKKLMFGSYNKRIKAPQSPYDWLTTDSDVVSAYDADPLCGFDPSVSLCVDLLSLIKVMGDKSNVAKMNLDVPVYLFSGGDDPVGSYGKGVRATAALLKSAGMTDVQLKLYPGMRHETLNERGNAQVMDDLYGWIDQRLH